LCQYAFLLAFGRTDCQVIAGISAKKKIKPSEIIDQSALILSKILQEKPSQIQAAVYLSAIKFL